MSESPERPRRYCGNCGTEIRSGTRFCVSCGASVARDPNSFDPTRDEYTGGSSDSNTVSHQGANRSNPGLGASKGLGEWFKREIVEGGVGSQASQDVGDHEDRSLTQRSGTRASGGESQRHAGTFDRISQRVSRWTPAQLAGVTLAAVLVLVLFYDSPQTLFLIGLLALIACVARLMSGNQKQKTVNGPPLNRLSFQPPPSECLNRAEGFMVKEGFTVNRGGSSVSFTSNTQFDMGAFVILLLLGIIPGLLYAIYMSVRKGPSVTLVATSTKAGTQLDVVGTNARDRALLENWIKGSQGIPQRPA